MHKLGIILLSLIVISCASRETPAPIVNITAPVNNKVIVKNSNPIVNNVSNEPQISKIDNSSSSPIVIDNNIVTTTVPAKSTSKAISVMPSTIDGSTVAIATTNVWIMPTQGKIIQPYNDSNKGIDISGKEGQAIIAASAGKVVYSGNGLKGYGNLIIIKHNSIYLSAYAHNKVNLVKEGDSVTKGQKIAEMGSTDSKIPMLHLEIRKNGKPINPETLIKG